MGSTSLPTRGELPVTVNRKLCFAIRYLGVVLSVWWQVKFLTSPFAHIDAPNRGGHGSGAYSGRIMRFSFGAGVKNLGKT